MDFDLIQETFDSDSYFQCNINDQPEDINDFAFFSNPSSRIFDLPYSPSNSETPQQIEKTPPKPSIPPQPPPPPRPTYPHIEYIYAQKIMTYEKFVKYIYSKINPDDAILITKEMLIKLEKIFISEFGHKWNKLRRDDKRKKERVLQRLYENVNIIYDKLENEPDKYLIDVEKSILNKYNKK